MATNEPPFGGDGNEKGFFVENTDTSFRIMVVCCEERESVEEC